MADRPDEVDEEDYGKLPIGEQLGPVQGRIAAAIHGFGSGMVPGVEKIAAGVDTGIQKLTSSNPKSYEETEKEYLGKLASLRETYPGVAYGSEFAGALLSPLNKIPGLGLGKLPATLANLGSKVATATRVGKIAESAPVVTRMLAHGVRGAASGAAGAGTQYFGETPTSEISQEGLEKAAEHGGMWGGGLGALGGALTGKIAKNRDEHLVQAYTSTAGDVRAPGKGAGATTISRERDKAIEIGEKGYEAGLLGSKFGQNAKDTFLEAEKLSDKVGKEGELIRKEIARKAVAKGNGPIDTAVNARDRIVDSIRDDMTQGGKRLLGPQMEALDEVDQLISQGFGATHKRPTFVGLNDIHNTYESISEILRGMRKDKDFAASIRGQALFAAERKLKAMFRDEATKVDPVLAKQLRKADEDYHVFQTIERLTGKAHQAELGARPGGGLLGRVAQGAGAYMGANFGPVGKLAGWALGGAAAKRTVAPNTLLYLLRKEASFPTTHAFRAGRLSAKLSPPELSMPEISAMSKEYKNDDDY